MTDSSQSKRAEIAILVVLAAVLVGVTVTWGVAIGTAFIAGALVGVWAMLILNARDEALRR